VFVVGVAVGPTRAAPDADGIVALSDEVRNPAPAYVMDVDITVEQPGERPVVAGYEVSIKGRDRSLVRFTRPASDKGKLLLMVRNDMWYYVPTVSRPIRISPLQRLLGQVANADIARTNYSVDYRATLVGTEVIDGHPCHVLDLTALDDQVGYHRIRHWVDAQTYQPVRSDFYAVSNALLKTARFGDLALVHGRLRPRELVVRDATKRDHVSVIRYSNIRIVSLADHLFRPESLRALP
jgi:outer membrane lipoprotein-sorting protein